MLVCGKLYQHSTAYAIPWQSWFYLGEACVSCTTLAAETMLYSGRVLSTFVCHQKTETCAECLRLLVAIEALTHVQH